MRRTFPIELEFVPGLEAHFYSAIIALLAIRQVAEDLAGRFNGLEIKPVTFLKGRRRPRYEGPEIVELWCKHRLSYNPELSTLREKLVCGTCSSRAYEILGTELPEREVQTGEDDWEMIGPTPREPGQGVILREEALEGNHVFDYERYMLCTRDVAEYVRAKRWTNLYLPEFGETI